MELKSFIKTAIKDIVGAIEESSKELGRGMHVEIQGHDKSIEFDIAVTAENSNSGSTAAGIRVLELFGFGTELNDSTKQAEVSRIKFRVFVNSRTFAQEEESRKKHEQLVGNR